MSHLTILPTVLRDADCLHASLLALGLEPRSGGRIEGFGGESHAVELQLTLACGEALGWARQRDGSLALVGDLQRLSRAPGLPALLGRITRAYAARRAVQDATRLLPDALIQLGG